MRRIPLPALWVSCTPMTEKFESLPSRLKAVSSLQTINDVPCLIVKEDDTPRPFLFWIHGRTAYKEIDPGRYLRCIRSGINVCAVDLPGHGERLEPELQGANRILPVMMQMVSEIDGVLAGLSEVGGFDMTRAALGGMSAGGMASIQRCLQTHPFKALILEATCGDWSFLRNKPMCAGLCDEAFHEINPVEHLGNWMCIPALAFHSKKDEWIPFDAAESFLHSLRMHCGSEADIEMVSFESTGAPFEHVGFGRQSPKVKEMQVEFLLNNVANCQEYCQ